MGNIPTLFQHNDNKLHVAAASSWYVLDAYSQESAAIYMLFNRQNDVDTLLNTTPVINVQRFNNVLVVEELVLLQHK